ncbi:13362_t:CDS:1, partial [Acaulospora morrowiae]
MRGQHIDDNSHNLFIIIVSNQDQENTPMRLRINTLLIKPVLAGSGYLLNPVISYKSSTMRGQHIDDNSHNLFIIIVSNQDQENTPMRLRINTLLIKPVLAGSGYLLNPVISYKSSTMRGQHIDDNSHN